MTPIEVTTPIYTTNARLLTIKTFFFLKQLLLIKLSLGKRIFFENK